MNTVQTLLIFAVVAAVLLYAYRSYKLEGFADLNVPASLFRATVAPGGAEEDLGLSPGAAFADSTEKIIESPGLPAMSIAEAEGNFGKMTSQTCYKSDIGESLKLTRNFLQRTNNYIHSHPDSCSAPNHEFVGAFYKPFDGVGMKPASGANYPPSTQCGSVVM